MPEGRDPLTEEMSPFYVAPKPADYYSPSCDYGFNKKTSSASSSSSGLCGNSSKSNTKESTALYDFIDAIFSKRKKNR